MALTDKLTAIGNAIREKTGGTELLTLDAMPAQIRAIQTGGGSSDSEEQLIKVIDKTIDWFDNTNITTIGENAFAYCYNLQYCGCLNATTIGASAFHSCYNLREVYFPNVSKIYNDAFYNCNISRIELPSLTEGSGNYMSRVFNYCQNLQYCDLGYYAGPMDGDWFEGCSSLETLILRNEWAIVELGSSSSFADTPIAGGWGYIYVPDAMVDSYKYADNWSMFESQIKPLSELES